MAKFHGWKQVETTIAKFFNTTRIPLSGGNSKHGTRSDSKHERLYIECKHTKANATIALANDSWWKAQREGKIPVVAIRLKGRGKRNRPGNYLVIHESDLLDVALERCLALEAKAARSEKMSTLVKKIRALKEDSSVDRG